MHQPGSYCNEVVVASRRLVAAADIDDCDVRVVQLLHVMVAESELPEHLDTTHLEPHHVVRMVDHAHLVGFGVAHAQLRFEDAGGSTSFSPAHAFAFQTGHAYRLN